MKRRRFVQAIMGTPAVTALVAQQQPVTQQPGAAQPAPGIPQNSTEAIQPPSRAAVVELPKLEPSIPDVASEMMPHFFTPAQFAALRKISEILMPPLHGRPGALEAKAPEFLDFLIGESPADRKDLYRTGLDALTVQARKRFGKSFAELDAQQTDALLAPLRQPWTFDTPADPIARFLRAAKQDIRTATTNSREYASAGGAGAGSRRAGGGLYWYPLD
jgi:hypothetical protein